MPSPRIRRRADGRFEARLQCGGIRHSAYARTAAEARQKLDALLRQAALGSLVRPTALTVAAWADTWLEQCQGRLRPSAIVAYQRGLRAVLPLVGGVRLNRLTAPALLLALTRLRERGVAPSTCDKAYVALRACLTAAVAQGVIARSPLERVPRPVPQRSERRRWTLAEARAFVAVARAAPHRHAPLLLFLAATGARVSEALGLTWADLDGETARVRRAVVWAGAAWSIQPPKTRAGARAVALNGLAREALGRVPRALDASSPVFWDGDVPPRPQTLARTMARLCALAGVPRVRVHDLRHLVASVMAEAGIPVTLAQRQLGHSSPTVTLAVYTHALAEGDVAAQAIEAALG